MTNSTGTETYGENYLSWKGWNSSQNFGKPSNFERIYFSNELRQCKVGQIKNILEVGFGNGCFFGYARQQGWNITGLEVNERLIECGQKNGFDTRAADELRNLPDDSFDLIVAFDVFEHISPIDILEYFKTLRTKLKIGGIILARYPNGDSPLGLHNQNSDITHLNAIGCGKMLYLAQNSGLQLVRIKSPAQPIFCGSMVYAVHRLFSKPIKWIIEILIRAVFFPRTNVNYTSTDVVAIIKKIS